MRNSNYYIFRGTGGNGILRYVVLDASDYNNTVSGDNIADLKNKLDILIK